jgi:hypothetical protein
MCETNLDKTSRKTTLTPKIMDATCNVTALKNVANLINCQIAYLLTLWKHDAVLPEFLKEGCLRKDDFEGDVRVEKLEDLLTIDESELRVRMNEASLTSKRKRQDTAPSKPGTRRKKKHIMSTPM